MPGGSSGGSCAAVAAGECFGALGIGYGRLHTAAQFLLRRGRPEADLRTVSRYGLIAYGSSLDQIGPVAKDVSDCAAFLEAIASHDPKDSTSIERDDYDFTSALENDVKGLRIAYRKIIWEKDLIRK